MKRIKDELYAGASQFKRPLGPSRGEPYGQTNVPSVGLGGGGASVGGGSTSQKLTTNDALSYLKEVKEMFHDQREKYDLFLEVMKDFKAQRTDTAGVIARVKELFKGHNNLIYGFNTFLPKGYEITLEEVEGPPKKTVEFEEAITFVNKIKKRFQNDEHVYKSFLDILNMYRKENKDINEVYSEVATLFEEHLDLLDEFTRFLPESLAPHSAQNLQFGLNQLRINQRGLSGHLAQQVHIEKERRRDKIAASRGDRDHSVDRADYIDDKAVSRIQRDQKKRLDKENRDRRNSDLEEDKVHNSPDKRKTARRVEGSEAYSGLASYVEKDNLKSMYNQAFTFCEKVKERLCVEDDYQTFLKCLNIFSSGIIQRKDLQNLVSDLLVKYPDLMDEFNQFFERCESIDGCQHLAGVMSKKSLCSEEHISRSVKVEEKEGERKYEIEAAKENERHKEKYTGKSIQELDLSDCERCTPSYRLLPQDYPIPSVSQRSELGAEVCNDHWVSVTSGSEDYSFKHMRRNQYEESLFRCEDDRFELDMLLESVGSALKRAEDLLNSLNEYKVTYDASFRIEDYFTVLNLRCIERLYGDHGLDAIDLLRKNPAAALPVILTRLKQKQEEWIKCRVDFNKVWADVYSKNHYKSLDHRSFYFKQQDSKNLSAKSLVVEIKELKEKMQKEYDILLSISAGYRQSIIPHFKHEYSDRSIHEELYKLVQYSCEEICSSKEQVNKVMRLWTKFLEPMLGVSPHSNVMETVEDAGKCKHTDSVSSNGEVNPSSRADINCLTSRHATNGDEHASSGISKFGGTGLGNKEKFIRESVKDMNDFSSGDPNFSAIQKDKDNVDGMDKRSGTGIDERTPNSNPSLPIEAENTNLRITTGNLHGSYGSQLRPSDTLNVDHQPVINNDAVPTLLGGDLAKPVVLANGVTSEGSKGSRFYDHSVGHLKVEKEEGELSPNGDFEEDNFGAYVDVGEKQASKPVEKSMDAEGENDVEADDEDSDNASEAGGDDASGTESAADEFSQEDNGGEEDAEHDEVDGKAESEGEADGSVDTNLNGGESALLPLSKRVLSSAKPLAKHVSTVLLNEKTKDSRVFYGNDDFYVLIRLHQILYERILSAKTNCLGGEVKWRNPKDANSPDPYARFMSALYSLLDGSAENTKFEDECRAIIGNQSYVLFTLDKLIYKLVKQLQAVATDETDNKLLQLYEYENLRKPGNVIDSVYYENARVLLHEENIYRLERSSSPPCLSIQLMDNVIEKPEAFAVSMDPTFDSYLQNEFLSVSTSKNEGQGIVLQRNKRRYTSLDDILAASMAMEGVEVINGLECKISCTSYKISYVLDTEDLFHRRKRRCLPQNSSARVERFQKFLDAATR